ncbi:FERM domain-containing protein 5, partial [Fragariocoptes setiger]
MSELSRSIAKRWRCITSIKSKLSPCAAAANTTSAKESTNNDNVDHFEETNRGTKANGNYSVIAAAAAAANKIKIGSNNSNSSGHCKNATDNATKLICSIRSMDGELMKEIVINRLDTGQRLLDELRRSMDLNDTKYFGLKVVKNIDEQDDLVDSKWLDLTCPVYRQIKHFLLLSSSLSSDIDANNSCSEPNVYSCPKVVLYLRVKFYPPNPCRISDSLARHYLWIQLKRDLKIGKLASSTDNLIRMAAAVLQYELGDAFDLEPNYASKFNILPDQENLEATIMEVHRTMMSGWTKRQAQAYFLKLAAMSETYGFDFYPVRDHQRHRPMLLGFNYGGIKTIRDRRMVHHMRWHDIQKITYERRMIIFHMSMNNIIGFKCLSVQNCTNLYNRLLEQQHFFTSDLAYMEASSALRRAPLLVTPASVTTKHTRNVEFVCPNQSQNQNGPIESSGTFDSDSSNDRMSYKRQSSFAPRHPFVSKSISEDLYRYKFSPCSSTPARLSYWPPSRIASQDGEIASCRVGSPTSSQVSFDHCHYSNQNNVTRCPSNYRHLQRQHSIGYANDSNNYWPHSESDRSSIDKLNAHAEPCAAQLPVILPTNSDIINGKEQLVNHSVNERANDADNNDNETLLKATQVDNSGNVTESAISTTALATSRAKIEGQASGESTTSIGLTLNNKIDMRTYDINDVNAMELDAASVVTIRELSSRRLRRSKSNHGHRRNKKNNRTSKHNSSTKQGDVDDDESRITTSESEHEISEFINHFMSDSSSISSSGSMASLDHEQQCSYRQHEASTSNSNNVCSRGNSNNNDRNTMLSRIRGLRRVRRCQKNADTSGHLFELSLSSQGGSRNSSHQDCHESTHSHDLISSATTTTLSYHDVASGSLRRYGLKHGSLVSSHRDDHRGHCCCWLSRWWCVAAAMPSLASMINVSVILLALMTVYHVSQPCIECVFNIFFNTI